MIGNGTLTRGHLGQERLARRRVPENLWHVMKPFSEGNPWTAACQQLGACLRGSTCVLVSMEADDSKPYGHPSALSLLFCSSLHRGWPRPALQLVGAQPLWRHTRNGSSLCCAAQHPLLLCHISCAWRAWFVFSSVLQLLQGWSPVLRPLRSGSLRGFLCAPTAAGSWNGPCTLLSVHSKELLVKCPAWILLFNSLVIPIYVKSKYFFTLCINYKLHFLWQYQKGCCLLGNITGLKGLCAALFLECCT